MRETETAIIDTRINTFMYKNYGMFEMDYDNNLQKINKLKDSHEPRTKYFWNFERRAWNAAIETSHLKELSARVHKNRVQVGIRQECVMIFTKYNNWRVLSFRIY